MENYNIDNPMAPLWIMYPNISRYSIGWRMGYGEDYAYKFISWYESLNNVDKTKYQKMFPEPKGWEGWYEESIDEDFYHGNILFWNKDGKIKYNVSKIEADFEGGKEVKYLFFWGHQPSKNGSITKTCLSQWWQSDFSIDTDKYFCMEQYMMAEKARLFEDYKTLDMIMKSKSPKQIKEFGRQVQNFDDTIWSQCRESIILNGNYAKFMQNDDLKNFLLGTRNMVLVEASPYDKIWGIGMAADESNIENPALWRGTNLLGFALMEVRDVITRVCKNYDKLNADIFKENL
ncbi:NADAR family protein [Clostridium sp. C8-1-8]|uniref:NADAR family protein n=1 Tax=Clostridium sp. C8-1-8 TaxID=2698831 RepID=UPI00136987CA|nr:NADAR family protein [Clostridium sp. C8-1-8]